MRFLNSKRAEHSPGNGESLSIRRQSPGQAGQCDLQSLNRCILSPHLARKADFLNLQQAAGNRAVADLIRAKLVVGSPGDEYEQEADSMANRVMTGSAGSGISAAEPQSESVEWYEDEEILQGKSLDSVPPEMTNLHADSALEGDIDLESRLNSSRGGGSPLPDTVRAFLEPRFEADFSGVRVHTDREAARMSSELNAQAFTRGQDIYMGDGKYNPSSDSGKWLLAHELTHVVQQCGPGKLSRLGNAGVLQLNGVTFPTYSEITADATVTTEAATAWQQTKDATTEATRREQAFWIRWNSSTGSFSVTGHSQGALVNNRPPAGASVAFSARPADSGNEYTVGMFHTHTPTTYWTAGYSRNVGPSGVDVTVHNGQRLPGVVYDYVGSAGKIRSGHPLNSAARLWHCGPNRRG